MKKLHIVYAPIAVMLSVMPQVQADSIESELGGEIVPYTYLKVPFGGGANTKNDHTFGFAVNQSEGDSSKLFANQRPPLFNMEFKGETLNSVKLNGLNIVDKRISYNADGSEKTDYVIQWEYVVGAVVGFGALWAMCEHNEWDLCHDDSKKKKGYSLPS